mgnify:CR=1 FL=1
MMASRTIGRFASPISAVIPGKTFISSPMNLDLSWGSPVSSMDSWKTPSFRTILGLPHVAVDQLTMHDQDALEPALEDADQRGVKPKELLADSHYGSNDCLRKGRERDVEIVSPSMPAKGTRQGKLTLEDFELDEQGLVLRCPLGQSPVETSVAEVRLQVLLDPVACASCPRQGNCPAAASGRRERRWQYTHDRVRQRRRRLEDASEAFRERYRWRAGIEATMSRFKHQMGMAKLRIRGIAKVTYTAMLRALGLNIHRVAAYRAAIG